MLFITSAEQFCRDRRMQECGTPWEAVMKRSAKPQKPKNVTKELNVLKIGKESQSIKWQNFTIQWDQNSN